MGQKAKNAGKKNSKTCNKLATTKSIKCSGGRMKLKNIETTYSILNDNNEIISELSSTENKSKYQTTSRDSLKQIFNNSKNPTLIKHFNNVEFMDCENIIKELK